MPWSSKLRLAPVESTTKVLVALGLEQRFPGGIEEEVAMGGGPRGVGDVCSGAGDTGARTLEARGLGLQHAPWWREIKGSTSARGKISVASAASASENRPKVWRSARRKYANNDDAARRDGALFVWNSAKRRVSEPSAGIQSDASGRPTIAHAVLKNMSRGIAAMSGSGRGS
jgi:hypothetical protein